MAETNDQFADLPLIEGDAARAIGDEYEMLRQKESVTEQEKDRIAEILMLAVYHPDVEFWVSSVTSRLAKTAGLITDSTKKEYQDQKALLREHIGTNDLPPVRGSAALPPVSQDSITQHVQDQAELKRMSIVLEKTGIAQPSPQAQARNQPNKKP